MATQQDVFHLVEKLYTSPYAQSDPWTRWAWPNHVQVVAKYAQQLAQKHHANEDFCVAGALLHDIADTVIARSHPEHERKSYEMAREILEQCQYTPEEITVVIEQIITPHSCNTILPTTLEGKILATADGMSHFLTDFYLYFCWMHFGPKDDYEQYKAWVLNKIDKHFEKNPYMSPHSRLS